MCARIALESLALRSHSSKDIHMSHLHGFERLRYLNTEANNLLPPDQLQSRGEKPNLVALLLDLIEHLRAHCYEADSILQRLVVLIDDLISIKVGCLPLLRKVDILSLRDYYMGL